MSQSLSGISQSIRLAADTTAKTESLLDRISALKDKLKSLSGKLRAASEILEIQCQIGDLEKELAKNGSV